MDTTAKTYKCLVVTRMSLHRLHLIISDILDNLIYNKTSVRYGVSYMLPHYTGHRIQGSLMTGFTPKGTVPGTLKKIRLTQLI